MYLRMTGQSLTSCMVSMVPHTQKVGWDVEAVQEQSSSLTLRRMLHPATVLVLTFELPRF